MDRGKYPRGLINRAIIDGDTRLPGAPHPSEYNFNIAISDLAFTVSKTGDTKWPTPIQLDPSQSNHSLVCELHNKHGHRTKDCHQLRKKIAKLLHKDHRQEFSGNRAQVRFQERKVAKKNESNGQRHVITILEGHRYPRELVKRRTNISIAGERRTWEYVPGGAPIFNRKSSETSPQLHNNTLVTSFFIHPFRIKRALVNPGSSTNIIRSRVTKQLGLLDQIMPASRIFDGFNMTIETTKGETILLANTTGTDRNAKSHVIKGYARQKCLIRTAADTPHESGTIPLRQMMESLAKNRIKTVYGEQHTSREVFALCNVAPEPILPPSKGSKDNRTMSSAKPD
uniref:Uncharacterized protein n=2 Tax=Nicotiana TaxID=4085 RepID=A0A1S3X0L0_TOBAC|nr:PREDICTED: uncharacterized protein LOC104228840 [Nicotiana sylvestris]XP_016433442.1 PREDICTED: uncharacterized protein LOC107759938 [Nicotiana tabacum]